MQESDIKPTNLKMPRPDSKSYAIVNLKELGWSYKDIAEFVKSNVVSVRVLYHKYKHREATNIAARDWARKNPDKIKAQRARAKERRPDIHSYHRYRADCRAEGAEPLSYEVWKQSRAPRNK